MDPLIVGDLHGAWPRLNQLISKKNPEIVLQCGDFGWWPSMEISHPVIYGRQNKWLLEGIKSDTLVYFCDGNHEEFPLLKPGGIQVMYKNVHHVQRGYTLTLSDGRVVLFMGGASSVDKHLRTPGKDWFPDENISEKDFDRAMNHDRIDIVISHTCPEEFDITASTHKVMDSNRIALSAILHKYKPSLWYFGHWHKYQQGKFNDTYWTCLDYPEHGQQWWCWMG